MSSCHVINNEAKGKVSIPVFFLMPSLDIIGCYDLGIDTQIESK